MLSIHSRAEIVALCFVTALRLKECELLTLFYAFRDNSFLQGFAHAHHRTEECGVVSTGANLVHKRLIDLQGIDREPPQIAQAGIPGAEVIKRELRSYGFECVEHEDSGCRSLRQRNPDWKTGRVRGYD